MEIGNSKAVVAKCRDVEAAQLTGNLRREAGRRAVMKEREETEE